MESNGVSVTFVVTTVTALASVLLLAITALRSDGAVDDDYRHCYLGIKYIRKHTV